MSKSKVVEPAFVTFSQLWDALGRVPLERIRMQPPPGAATEEDVIAICESKFGRLCELIDHTLVEKTMGFYESRVATVLARSLDDFAEAHRLGFVIGEGGMLRVEPRQVRLPDVAFFSWEHFPEQVLPEGQILDQVPDLAVEVLSPSNTRAEMDRKRREYFLGGCRLVWEIDPQKRLARVYTAPDESKVVREKGKLTGGDVLPGFEMPLAQLFERAGRRRRA